MFQCIRASETGYIMAALSQTTVRIRVRFAWWMKFVLRVASVVYRVTHSARLTNLALWAARMQLKTEDPSGDPHSKLNTRWRWFRGRVRLTVKKVS